MFIPKSKMPAVIQMIDEYLERHGPNFHEGDEVPDENMELMRQIHDRASLCQHGDGTGLDIDVRYAPGPSAWNEYSRGLCSNCGSNLIKGKCFSC